MSPSYKLTYFNLRARAEVTRQLFALAGQPYEDHRISYEEWENVKPTTPFGQIPVLEVDGKPVAQSNAIVRYLANKFGFAGVNDWESAQIDALNDQFWDYCNALKPFFMVLMGRSTEDKEELYKTVVVPQTASFFPIIGKLLKESKSGFLIGEKVSYADLALAEHTNIVEKVFPEVIKDFKELHAHAEKVRSIPEIKKWLETRPDTPY